MKIYSYLLLGAMFLLGGCSDLLDIDPKNKIPADELFSTPEGVQAHMANLYGRLPIEDFTYSPNRGFNVGVGTDVNNAGFMAAHFCDEAIHPEYNDFGEEWFDYWEDGYKLIRDLNSLLVTIPTLTSITEQQKNEINAETHFLRAYTYFALAKRYGGVPIIKEPQEYNGKKIVNFSAIFSFANQDLDFPATWEHQDMGMGEVLGMTEDDYNLVTNYFIH